MARNNSNAARGVAGSCHGAALSNSTTTLFNAATLLDASAPRFASVTRGDDCSPRGDIDTVSVGLLDDRDGNANMDVDRCASGRHASAACDDNRVNSVVGFV